MSVSAKYKEFPITWEKGLLESVEDSMLPPGSAAALQNWVGDTAGGLRARVGWSKGSTTSVPSTRKGWGIGHLALPRRPREIQSVQGSNTTPTATPINVSATWDSATTEGNLLVAILYMTFTTNTSFGDISITPPAGGWTATEEPGYAPTGTSAQQYVAMYYIENAASQSGSKQFTVSGYSGNAVVALELIEVTNIATSSALDKDAAVNASDQTNPQIAFWAKTQCNLASAATNAIGTREAHGLSVGDEVRFYIHQAVALPSPLAEDTSYYVIDVADTVTFTVSTTLGGTAVDITTTGTADTYSVGKYPRSVPVGFSIAGVMMRDSTDNTLTVSAGWTGHDEFYIDNSTADLNAKSAYVVYESETEKGEVTFTSNNQANEVNIIRADFKAAGYSSTDGFYFVANNEDPDMKIYYLDRDDLSAGTWTLLKTHDDTAADTVPFAFTSGNEMLFWVHPSLSDTWAWGGLGTTPAAISGSPSGRCIAWHKNRLYIGGAANEPWKLHFSATGDHEDWTSADAGYIEVGKGDGEAIEDVLPFEDGLLIGKQTSLWFLVGNGAGGHRLIRIPEGNCAPGRTLLSTPYGAIVAGRYEVHLYTAGEARLISRPIRDSYGLTGSFLTCSVRDESAYICDQGSGTVWAIDFSSGGSWRTEVVASASTEGPACVYNQGRDQLFTPRNASVGSLLNYRQIPGSSRAKDFDTLSEAYVAWTPEMWLAGPSKKFTPMYLFLKIRQRGGDAADADLTVTPYINGSADTAMTFEVSTAGVRWFRRRITDKSGIESLQLRFAQTLASTDAAVLDIEEGRIGYDVEEVR